MTITGTALTWLGGQVFDAAFSESVKRVFKRRLDAAREIMIEELENGNANLADVADQDEAAAMVFEYGDAARVGTARRNLRLLAQIMAGALVSPPIYADEFLHWSRILADLTREELIVLAKFHNQRQQPDAKTLVPNIYERIKGEMIESGLCSNEDDFESILQALGRTGLMIQKSGFGKIVYAIPPRLEHLMKLVRVDDALAEPDR